MQRIIKESTIKSGILSAFRFAVISVEGASDLSAEDRQNKILADGDWGIKYDKECIKFKKEWELISDAQDEEKRHYISDELSPAAKAKV